MKDIPPQIAYVDIGRVDIGDRCGVMVIPRDVKQTMMTKMIMLFWGPTEADKFYICTIARLRRGGYPITHRLNNLVSSRKKNDLQYVKI
jgi:hypothetical protein